jgi:hypothetical protein
LLKVKDGDVGVSGGEEGPEGCGNARLGVAGPIFAKYAWLSRTMVVNGCRNRQWMFASTSSRCQCPSRYLQRGEERRGEMQFMISNSVENPTLVRAVRSLGGFVDISLRGDKGSGLSYRKGQDDLELSRKYKDQVVAANS